MTPQAIAQLATQLVAQDSTAREDNVIAKYAIAVQIRSVQATSVYGDQALCLLAAGMHWSLNRLYSYIAVANKWDAAALRALAARRMTNGGALTFNHLELLAGIRSASRVNYLLGQIFLHNWNSRHLADARWPNRVTARAARAATLAAAASTVTTPVATVVPAPASPVQATTAAAVATPTTTTQTTPALVQAVGDTSNERITTLEATVELLKLDVAALLDYCDAHSRITLPMRERHASHRPVGMSALQLATGVTQSAHHPSQNQQPATPPAVAHQ